MLQLLRKREWVWLEEMEMMILTSPMWKTRGKVGEIEEAFKISPEAFSQRYNAVKPGKDDGNIVFHCRADIRSRTAMTAAHELGYSKARHYYNGFLGWQEQPEMSRY